MKRVDFLLFIVALLGLFLGGCCPKTTPQSSYKERDYSQLVETKLTHEFRMRVVEVEFHLPVEEKERVTESDSSFLETTIATSFAYVTNEGKLYHNLQNKSTIIKAPVIVEDEYVQEERLVATDEKSDNAEVKIVRERYVPWYYKGAMWVAVVALVGWIYRGRGWLIRKIV